ncbi:MAG: molybdopterin molybdenumtransferase MoeA [Candidatus Abyssobacteria bacterium SURF_5]|uniref:Molybdopterin molybdenumtransferase n=1 Tax=Abyssobacteria bacterium (strain SURF_5) TaxID=2093360 RepID=A0A3A4P8Z9_ABYX5|nr:MAG: molybdopterin molybdenumtransferase MoeA [Candidatus Abyssubacteria bacterium SURF_5]
MICFDEALKIVLDSVQPTERIELPLLNALGLVAAEEVESAERIPPFDNSAMDGYAVRAQDTAGASKDRPAELKVILNLPAGKHTDRTVGPGEAIRIMTGAPIPAGADTVVQVELTERLSDGAVKILQEHEKNKNIRMAGEDIFIGQKVLTAGEEITPAKLGLLASIGRANLRVYRRPRVAILATGDELVNPGEPLAPGKIRNSNSYTMIAQTRICGAEPAYLGIARDTKEDVRDHIQDGMSADVILTSGGVSVGDYDYVKDAFQELGVEFRFTKVAIKPGMPTVFGLWRGKLVFGLPGNPVSSMVIFEEFVRPALLKMMGKCKLRRPLIEAVLEGDVKKNPERMHLVRGIVRREADGYRVSTTGPQGSGILLSMDHANGIMMLPKGIQLKKGDRVKVQLITLPEVD